MAAAVHASLEVTPQGQILATDLGSLNGLLVGGTRHRGVSGLPLPDNLIQIGRTRLRLRTSHEALAPEMPDLPRSKRIFREPAWLAGFAAAAAALELGYSGWLGAPRDVLASIVTLLAGAGAIAAVWIGFWALLSRVMRSEWRWLQHMAIFLGLIGIFDAVGGLTSIGSFMLARPEPEDSTMWLAAVGLAASLYLHLRHASHMSAKRAAVVACLLPALVVGAGLWLMSRSQMQDANRIASRVRIYPPALRMRPAASADDFFASTPSLRKAADDKRKAAVAANPEDNEE